MRPHAPILSVCSKWRIAAESRVVSTRLKERLAELGMINKERVPEMVYAGSEEMQRGFLQGIFSADGTVLDNVEKGVSVRLWSVSLDLLTMCNDCS